MAPQIDHTLFHFINQDMANPVFDFLCPILRNRFTWLPFYIIGGIYLLYKYKMQGLLIIIGAGLTILCCDQAANAIKWSVHRLRPCHLEPGVRLLIDQCSSTFSFPSNHAANHFGLAAFISIVFRQYRWLIAALILWAASVAFSQVYVGIHYPADVAAGAVLGSMLGLIVAAIYVYAAARPHQSGQ
ncbi:MAG: phosphatase PAP2 family protein [Bacteroidetes bacterium]|nr:phosphatase PAP2 family protein [Bacteroidota bacterium]MBS1685004.1 phosphatase PAP2 family protein [Bacteroidota bacterium]